MWLSSQWLSRHSTRFVQTGIIFIEKSDILTFGAGSTGVWRGKQKHYTFIWRFVIEKYSTTMPKNKKQESSSSDSDEGPVDRNQPPEKKSKSSASSNRTADKEPTWALQKNKFVKIREFKGRTFIDIREFYEKNGEMLPGKKGISLTPEQWRKLVELGEEINDTLSSVS